MGDTHPVEAHLNDDVEGEDLFIPGDPEAVRLKGRKGFNVLSFANNHCMHAGYRAFLRTMEVMRESGISPVGGGKNIVEARSEEHTSELQSLMRISYAVFCLKKKNIINQI